MPTFPGRWVLEDGTELAVEVTSEQYHGRACVRCGSTMDGLVDAGHLYVGPGGWRAKACVRCDGSAAAA